MKSDLPEPICTAFLACRHILAHPETGEDVLVGVPTGHQYHQFPTAIVLAFFARLFEARGEYAVEIQLVDSSGDVVWRDGPDGRFRQEDPLKYQDLKLLNFNVVIPSPGEYEFALVLNQIPVARQRFKVVDSSKRQP